MLDNAKVCELVWQAVANQVSDHRLDPAAVLLVRHRASGGLAWAVLRRRLRRVTPCFAPES